MKKFQIFRPGKHVSNAGVSLEFTEEQLRESIAAYDPALHQAPITVGHPKDNLPAYGWVGALSFDEAERTVDAEPVQLHDEFVMMVKDGRFTKRSASWYLPDAAANPTPGKLYLRHVAFLGAQPPAVKGLRAVEFNDDETGTIEFADSFDTTTIAGLFRNLREFFIGKHGQETADQVIPNYSVTSLETSAQRAATEETSGLPAFTEKEPEEMTITKEQLDAAVAAAKTETEAAIQATMQTKIDAAAAAATAATTAQFAEKDKAVQTILDRLATNDRTAKRALLGGKIDTLAATGKVLPAQRDAIIAFAETLDADNADSIEFGEGEKKKKYSQRDFYLELLSQSPVAVEYSELSQASDFAETGGISAADVAKRAQALQDKARSEGRNLSLTQAVYEVTKIRAA